MVDIRIECNTLSAGQREMISHRLFQFADDLVIQQSPKYDDWLLMSFDGREYEVDDIGMCRLIHVGDWQAIPEIPGLQGWHEEAQRYMDQGKRVSAVKAVRQGSGMSLRDAMDYCKTSFDWEGAIYRG